MAALIGAYSSSSQRASKQGKAPLMLTLAMDFLVTILLAVGSVRLAMRLGCGSCVNGPSDYHFTMKYGGQPPVDYTVFNRIINDAVSYNPFDLDPNGDYKLWIPYEKAWYVSRCMMAQALSAFMFFACAAFGGSTLLHASALRLSVETRGPIRLEDEDAQVDPVRD